MSKYKYSTKISENSAKAVGISLPISTKYAVETLNMIRNKPTVKAKAMLELVIAKKKPVAFNRYKKEIAHQKGKGVATGKYPIKCCTYLLNLIKSAEANAQFKGLNTANLIIKHASAQQGPTTRRYGRHPGKAKKTHVEIVLEEKIKTNKKQVTKKSESKKPVRPKETKKIT